MVSLWCEHGKKSIGGDISLKSFVKISNLNVHRCRHNVIFKKYFDMSVFFEKTDIYIEVSNAILDLPRVSIMCASDELFMLYLVELNAEGRKAIQDFFYISRKYNFMTDELEKKEEMFIGVTKKYDSLFDPCTNSKIKKTAKLKKLSKWELIKMIEKYGIHKYIATKRQKPLNINYQKMVKKIIKKNSREPNTFMRVHFKKALVE